MERENRRSTYGADASSPRVELPSGFGRMINPERVTVTSRQTSKRSVVPARARLRRTAIFHVTSGSTGPLQLERLWDFVRGRGARGTKQSRRGKEKTETETKSLRWRINFNWITVNIVSAYVEALHSSAEVARSLRAKSRLFHLITKCQRMSNYR